MKTTKLAMLILAIALVLYILIPGLSWAKDGSALYKTKCSPCDGSDIAGQPAARMIASLLSEDAKKQSGWEGRRSPVSESVLGQMRPSQSLRPGKP
jgi:hypothetical protein